MATITRTGTTGLATYTFTFDDVALRLIAVSVNNTQETRTLNIEVSKGTFIIAPGTSLSRNLNNPQQEAYALVNVTKPDGSTVVGFAFPYRVFFSG